MSPPRVRVNRGNFSSTVDILCFSTKLDDMNKCDAPESNSTVARTEPTRNSPSTTPWAFWASWVFMWLTRARPNDCCGCLICWLLLLLGLVLLRIGMRFVPDTAGLGPFTLLEKADIRCSWLVCIRTICYEVSRITAVETSHCIISHLPSAILLSLDIALSLVTWVRLMRSRWLGSIVHWCLSLLS